MPIAVTCPNGHALKVKDKYAGKTGLCPKCGVQMQVPALAAEEDEFIEMIPREKEPEPAPAPKSAAKQASIFDDDEDLPAGKDRRRRASASATESLLTSGSVIKHLKKCPKCFEMAPLWHTRCLRCDYFFHE